MIFLTACCAVLFAACGGHTDPNPAPFTIVAQPVDTSVVAGGAATFSVSAPGASAYQWQISTDVGVTWINLVGATTSTYTADVAAADGTRYRVVVTGPKGESTTSSAVKLTVTVVVVAPAITVQPANQAAVEGQNANFSVTATGTSPAYQWQASSDGGATYADVVGATNATLSLTSVALVDNGKRVRVGVSNSAGSVISSVANLTVSPMPAAPAFTTQPAAASIIAPMPATFSVVALGIPTPTLQWQLSTNAGATFTDIAGATAASYTVDPTNVGQSGSQYRAVATNSVASTNSNAATLTVTAMPVAPSFTLQPVDANAREPNPVTFTVAAVGTPAPALQWTVSTDGGATFANITGATASSYTTPPTSQADAGKIFVCVATNSVAAVASERAAITSVIPPPDMRFLSVLTGGIGGYGYADAPGSSARFSFPSGSAVDDLGNVYIADESNQVIRKITPSGSASTLAGTANSQGTTNGPGNVALFSYPRGIAVDSARNVYVAEVGSHTIRKITPAGVVSTLAGTPGVAGVTDGGGGASAQFDGPSALAVDSGGNVYVADTNNSTIRVVLANGSVATFAGSFGQQGSTDGAGPSARFKNPAGITIDALGTVYVADTGNNTIRKISAGVTSTLAGTPGVAGAADGSGAAASFTSPHGLAVDAAGNVFVADTGSSTLRKITPAGSVTTLAGTAAVAGRADGSGAGAQFNQPWGLGIDGSGNLRVADTLNQTVRTVTPSGVVTTLAGFAPQNGNVDGTGAAARVSFGAGVAVDSAGNLFVADTGNHSIRKVTAAGVTTTFAGSFAGRGSQDGNGTAAGFLRPAAVAVDGAGNVYVADQSNHTIRKINAAGDVTTLAGTAGAQGSQDGTGSAAGFANPSGVAVDAAGMVYVADTGNQTVRKITPAGVVTTLAGSPGNQGNTNGTGSAALFNNPVGIAVDSSGTVFVVDSSSTVRKITAGGVVTTLAGLADMQGRNDGTGAAARFVYPVGLAIDSLGNVLVADTGNNTIRKVTPGGLVTTVLGTADGTSVTRLGVLPQLNRPHGIAVLGANRIAITSDAEAALLIGTF